MAFGQVCAVQASSLPVSQFSTCFEPGVITAPHLPITFEALLSIDSGPTSPQSRLRAQRPETNSGLVSATSMLSSFGGPNSFVALRNSSALAKASLLISGLMSLVLKKAPWLVPLAWIIDPAISV